MQHTLIAYWLHIRHCSRLRGWKTSSGLSCTLVELTVQCVGFLTVLLDSSSILPYSPPHPLCYLSSVICLLAFFIMLPPSLARDFIGEPQASLPWHSSYGGGSQGRECREVHRHRKMKSSWRSASPERKEVDLSWRWAAPWGTLGSPHLIESAQGSRSLAFTSVV